MDVDKKLLLPKRLLAKAFGVSTAALDRWDINPHEKRGREQLYYLPEVIEWRLNRDAKEKLDLTKERARLAAAQAEKTEMENEKTRGSHIDKAEVIKEAAGLINSIKASIETEGNRHSKQSANQKPGAVKRSFNLTIERAFKNVTNSYSNGNGTGSIRVSSKRASKIPAEIAAVRMGG